MENAHLPTVPCNRLYFAVRPLCSVLGQTEIGKIGKTLVRIFDGIDAESMRAPKISDLALVGGVLSHAMDKEPAERRIGAGGGGG